MCSWWMCSHFFSNQYSFAVCAFCVGVENVFEIYLCVCVCSCLMWRLVCLSQLDFSHTTKTPANDLLRTEPHPNGHTHIGLINVELHKRGLLLMGGFICACECFSYQCSVWKERVEGLLGSRRMYLHICAKSKCLGQGRIILYFPLSCRR